MIKGGISQSDINNITLANLDYIDSREIDDEWWKMSFDIHLVDLEHIKLLVPTKTLKQIVQSVKNEYSKFIEEAVTDYDNADGVADYMRDHREQLIQNLGLSPKYFNAYTGEVKIKLTDTVVKREYNTPIVKKYRKIYRQVATDTSSEDCFRNSSYYCPNILPFLLKYNAYGNQIIHYAIPEANATHQRYNIFNNNIPYNIFRVFNDDGSVFQGFGGER